MVPASFFCVLIQCRDGNGSEEDRKMRTCSWFGLSTELYFCKLDPSEGFGVDNAPEKGPPHAQRRHLRNPE